MVLVLLLLHRLLLLLLLLPLLHTLGWFEAVGTCLWLCTWDVSSTSDINETHRTVLVTGVLLAPEEKRTVAPNPRCLHGGPLSPPCGLCQHFGRDLMGKFLSG